MKHKSEIQSFITKFIKFVQVQFHTTIKAIRSDNGLEFLSLQPFLNQHGIELQRSYVYTPQQNGVVERKHRHILNIARSLVFQANVLFHFRVKVFLQQST